MSGREGEFERLGFFREITHHGFSTGVGLQNDDELRFRTEGDFAEAARVVREALRGGGDLQFGPVGIFRGIGHGMQRAADEVVTGFNDEWRGGPVTGGQAGDVDLDGIVEIVRALGAEGEAHGGAGHHGGVHAGEFDAEVGLRLADGE